MFHVRTHLLGLDHEVTVIAHDLRGTTLVTVEHDEGASGSSVHEHALDTALTVADAEAWLKSLPDYAEVEDPGQDAIDALAEILPVLTDEQAELFSGLYPEWAEDTAYKVGDRVRHDGLLYRCVQAHTSQEGWEPGVAASLWVRTSTDEWPAWVQPTGAHDAYAQGDKVSHADKHWVSAIDANAYEPGVYGWTEAA